MTRALAACTLAALAFSAAVPGCAPLRPPGAPKPGDVAVVAPGDWPRLDDDGHTESLRRALVLSLERLAGMQAERSYNLGGEDVGVARLRRTLETFLELIASGVPEPDWDSALRARFELRRAAAAPLFTGYYEPELRASRERTERFRYPIYRLPDDLVDIDLGAFCGACEGTVAAGRVNAGRVIPYFSRREIDRRGVLEGRDAALAWLDDPVEAFFLHVQGSGLLRFDDGSAMRVGVAGSNGRPYRSIGKLLVEQGKLAIEDVSLQSIKRYLREHPEEQDALLDANERYIFFGAAAAGPIGSLGAPLTPGRSIAVDPKSYPLGALAFIRTERPGDGGGPAPLVRFVTTQDTGAAITGPARIDVFWGTGPDAERLAGPMRSGGELYILLAK